MKKLKLILFITALILIIILVLIVTSYKTKFEIPPFDKNAKEYKEELKIDPIEVGNNYKVYINGDMKTKKNNLQAYIASDKSNKVYIKARIYQNERIIGETDLIKPGYYIDKIKLKEKITENILIKIMSYNTKTYQSEGSVTFEVKVKKNEK